MMKKVAPTSRWTDEMAQDDDIGLELGEASDEIMTV